MTALQVGALALVAVGAPMVVLVRDPLRQALCFGVFGTALAILFFVFQAPDVALSQIVVSAVGLPVIVVLALVKLREEEGEGEE
ncbi:MAG: Na(+)/H(+) antiporter subunit B [Solirubrobacterales bacterium]